MHPSVHSIREVIRIFCLFSGFILFNIDSRRLTKWLLFCRCSQRWFHSWIPKNWLLRDDELHNCVMRKSPTFEEDASQFFCKVHHTDKICLKLPTCWGVCENCDADYNLERDVCRHVITLLELATETNFACKGLRNKLFTDLHFFRILILIVERAEKIGQELDGSAKRKTGWGMVAHHYHSLFQPQNRDRLHFLLKYSTLFVFYFIFNSPYNIYFELSFKSQIDFKRLFNFKSNMILALNFSNVYWERTSFITIKEKKNSKVLKQWTAQSHDFTR